MNFKEWVIKSGGMATAIIILFIIFIFFLKADINNRVQKIVDQGDDLRVRIQSIESLTSLQANSEKADELLQSLSASLPERDQLINFSKDLERYAKRNRLDFGFSFDQEIEGTDTAPGINHFTMTSRGSYSNFLKFLKSVEQSKYFIKFDTLGLTNEDNKFNILIKGEVFSQ